MFDIKFTYCGNGDGRDDIAKKTCITIVYTMKEVHKGRGKMSQVLPPPFPQILQVLESPSGLQTAPTPTLIKLQVSVSDITKVIKTLGNCCPTSLLPNVFIAQRLWCPTFLLPNVLLPNITECL